MYNRQNKKLAQILANKLRKKRKILLIVIKKKEKKNTKHYKNMRIFKENREKQKINVICGKMKWRKTKFLSVSIRITWGKRKLQNKFVFKLLLFYTTFSVTTTIGQLSNWHSNWFQFPNINCIFKFCWKKTWHCFCASQSYVS